MHFYTHQIILLNAVRSDSFCIKPPLPSGLNLPVVIYLPMFTVCTALSAKALCSPISKTNALVDLSLKAFLVMSVY